MGIFELIAIGQATKLSELIVRVNKDDFQKNSESIKKGFDKTHAEIIKEIERMFLENPLLSQVYMIPEPHFFIAKSYESALRFALYYNIQDIDFLTNK